MTKTITVTVKPEIDREAVEEAAQLAAALFLSSFAVAVLEGIAVEEPPEEVLERVKAETLEKAAQEESRRKYEDMIHRPESITVRGGDSHIHFGYAVHNPQNPLHAGQNRPRSDVQPSEASQGTPSATDAPEAAQTLADLTPCLGDRVRVRAAFDRRDIDMQYGWLENEENFHWFENGRGVGYFDGLPSDWTVLEHLPPVAPEEPPVGAGMLLSATRSPWRHGTNGWQVWDSHEKAWSIPVQWDVALDYGPFRPATPADLAEHGVDEQGEPVGTPPDVRQDTPPGLTVTVDGSLLNWEGVNYVRRAEAGAR